MKIYKAQAEYIDCVIECLGENEIKAIEDLLITANYSEWRNRLQTANTLQTLHFV